MLCFKDMTFCSSPDCINYDCDRMLSKKVLEGAKKWWGSDDAPIALTDFTKNCPSHITKERPFPLNKSATDLVG